MLEYWGILSMCMGTFLICPINGSLSATRANTVHSATTFLCQWSRTDHGPPSRWPRDRALARNLSTCQKSNQNIAKDKHAPRLRFFRHGGTIKMLPEGKWNSNVLTSRLSISTCNVSVVLKTIRCYLFGCCQSDWSCSS